MPVLAASAYEWVLALHIIAVLVAFGWTFALPLIFVVATKMDPGSLPVLHRIEVVASRTMVNPALVVIVGAGVFMASDGHHWSEFFVQWGLGAVIVIGRLVGSVLIPASKAAEEAAREDLAGWDGSGEFEPGERYAAATRKLNTIGSLASGLVLVTIVIMVTKP